MDAYQHGIRLFNAQHFFDAHETWEDVWRESTGPERKLLQGLIQVAVAFHHHSTGNVVGACSLLDRGRKNLQNYPGEYRGLRVAPLLESIAQWREALSSGGSAPSFPILDSAE